MWDHVKTTAQAIALGAGKTVDNARRNVPLFVRMTVVITLAAVALNWLNAATTFVVLAGPADATVFVMDQVHLVARASVKLVAVGNDVVAFLGL